MKVLDVCRGASVEARHVHNLEDKSGRNIGRGLVERTELLGLRILAIAAITVSDRNL